MTVLEYQMLRDLFPDADDNTMFQMQKKINYERMKRRQEERKEAQEAGKEVAQLFNEAFEKELAKLFK